MSQQSRDSKRFPCRVEALTRLNQYYLLLTLREPDHFDYLAGQHTEFYFNDDNGEFRRFYSMASAPGQRPFIEFCLLLYNDSRTEAQLSRLVPGNSLDIGPARGFFTVRDAQRPLAFVAGGSGIAPLRSIILDMLANPDHQQPLSLIYGCQKGSVFPYREQFQELAARDSRFSCVLVSEDGADKTIRGRPTDVLKTAVDPSAHVYLCGPPGMINASKQQLLSMGLRRDAIIVET